MPRSSGCRAGGDAPTPGSRREAGRGPAARCRPRSYAERREGGDPTALFPKSGTWEPSRGAAGKGTPAAGPRCAAGGTFEGGGQAPRALLRHIPDPAARTEGDAGDAVRPALLARRSGSLHSDPSLRSALRGTAPGSGSKIPKPGKKEKARGGGAADSSVLPVLLWGDSSAATGGEGPRGGGGEGARPAGSGGCCCTAGGEREEGPPTPGATASGRGWMLARPSPRALSCLKRYRVFGDQPGKPRHVRKTRETSGGE